MCVFSFGHVGCRKFVKLCLKALWVSKTWKSTRLSKWPCERLTHNMLFLPSHWSIQKGRSSHSFPKVTCLLLQVPLRASCPSFIRYFLFFKQALCFFDSPCSLYKEVSYKCVSDLTNPRKVASPDRLKTWGISQRFVLERGGERAEQNDHLVSNFTHPQRTELMQQRNYSLTIYPVE